MNKIKSFYFLPFLGLLSLLFLKVNGQNSSSFWSSSAVNRYYDSLSFINKSIVIDSAFKTLTIKKKFNGVVLISKNGSILIHQAIGYANLRRKTKLTKNTLFELASVSKQVTATAIMLLEERGLLKYSDTVQRFFPNFPYPNITIHLLLCHRSGLPQYYNFAPKYWKNKNLDLSNDSLMAMIAEHKPLLNFQPNAKYEYNNTGYCVLASIVEKISGKSFADFANEEIFLKAGMKNTIICTKLSKISNYSIADGHDTKGRLRSHTWLAGTTGDKGVYSTAYDLYLWDKALRENKILKKESLVNALIGKSTELSPFNNYGYGWHLGAMYWGQPLVFHGGLWNGFNTLFIRRLNDDVLIIVLSNYTNWSFSRQSSNWFDVIDGV
jgi:CubicO group peptidase (beta-lactamase class C family)